MIITKHNRITYILAICFAIPAISAIVSMLYLHSSHLKNQYAKVSLKLLYATAKNGFDKDLLLLYLALFAVPCIIVAVLLDYFFYVDFEVKPYFKYVRGVKIASINYLKLITKNRKNQQLLLCGVSIPHDVENLHIMIAGSTGTGKSTILNETIASAIYRGDKLIIIDPNGTFLSKFYREGDHILNPFDARSEIWDPFFDIKNKNYDYEQIVFSMIPPQNSASGEEWNGYARTLLRGIMRACGNQDIFTMHYVIDLLNNATNEELKQFVCGTEAEALFTTSSGDSANNNTVNSTRFVLAKYISSYQYLPKNLGCGFSIRDYIDSGKGNLFITWREDMLQALKPMVSTFCDLISNAILSSSNTQNKLFIVDELGSLNQQPALEQLATKGRKHGVNIIACIQSTSQLNDVYGKEKAITLRSCFRNLVVLGGGSIDHHTADDLSTSLGEHEVIRTDKSNTYSSVNKKDLVYKERIVLPSEIQALKQLEGYLAFALDYPIAKFKIDRVDYPVRTDSFVEIVY
jgi:type IV secretory pathway TraG/TraD family ATPase VirD4